MLISTVKMGLERFSENWKSVLNCLYEVGWLERLRALFHKNAVYSSSLSAIYSRKLRAELKSTLYFLPMMRLELATPGLQTQCSSH